MTESGLVVVDKPAGLTSHDVVARVRQLAGTPKVGHAGTLDPMATGVLVLGIGKATRLLGHLALTEKSYDATIRLGQATTTDDAEGTVLTTTSASATQPMTVRDVLGKFVGDLDQVPSSVSAIKVAGRRAHERVRSGEAVVLAPRPVRIETIEVHDVRREGELLDVDVSLRCSSGTYVRALARDVGAVLGVGGHLTALRRTSVGGIGLDQARTLPQLADELVMTSLGDGARAHFPAYSLDEQQAADVRFGRRLALRLEEPGPVAVFAPGGEFLALYERAGTVARAVAVFC
ncbi:MAG: tRNA pseudouridine(55) synthase TruB [Actinomycetota bacterium]|nr:tRNA pseudouridine(55) synthase TruB [Actinomycetota bacterium]